MDLFISGGLRMVTNELAAFQRLGIRAMLAGTLADLMSASLVGIMLR